MKLPLFNQRTVLGGEGCTFNPVTGRFEIHAFAVPYRETEVWGMYPWRCGTKDKPTIIEWEAKATGFDEQRAIYVGGGEPSPRDGYRGIFVVYREDQVPSFCFRTGIGEGTVKRVKLDFGFINKLHKYRIEWTDEPRATLYVDKVKKAEFKENVPICPIYPITEVSMFRYPMIRIKTVLEWSPSLFETNTIPR